VPPRQTGYLPHPAGPGASPVAPVGGYVLGIPANLPPERVDAAVEALIVFTRPKRRSCMSRTAAAPTHAIPSADPEVRRRLFTDLRGGRWDVMARRAAVLAAAAGAGDLTSSKICGEEFHDMLRGLQRPRQALRNAQSRADAFYGPRDKV
jgi:multiple sugar transport system substrate-binding protein